jgi:hypothetical protein
MHCRLLVSTILEGWLVEDQKRAPEIVELPAAIGPVTWLVLASLGGVLVGGLGVAGGSIPVRCLVSLISTAIVVGLGLLAILGVESV